MASRIQPQVVYWSPFSYSVKIRSRTTTVSGFLASSGIDISGIGIEGHHLAQHYPWAFLITYSGHALLCPCHRPKFLPLALDTAAPWDRKTVAGNTV